MGKGVFEQLIDFDLPLVAIDPDKITLMSSQMERIDLPFMCSSQEQMSRLISSTYSEVLLLQHGFGNKPMT